MKPYLVFALSLAGALAFLFSSEASLAATNTDSTNRASTTAQCKSRFATLDIAIDYKEHEATVTRLCRNGKVRTEVYATTSTSSIVRQTARDFKIGQRQVRQRADFSYINTDAIAKIRVVFRSYQKIDFFIYRADGRLYGTTTTNQSIINDIIENRFAGNPFAYERLIDGGVFHIRRGTFPAGIHTTVVDAIISERLVTGVTREQINWMVRYEVSPSFKVRAEQDDD